MECKELFEPTSYEEVLEIVRNANNSGKKVHVLGLGTHHVVEKPFEICISTIRLNKILESSTSDLYVSVQSGVRFNDLQEHLSNNNLFFPAFYEGTIGGLISTNLPSPFSLWYPYPRDLILGAKIVTGDGKLIKSGGKTTKFSSGYKIWKALSGALGTLGIYLELYIKVLPKPEKIISVKVDRPEDIIRENPWGIISFLDSSKISTYAIFAGFSSYIEKISKNSEVIEGILPTDMKCERIYGVVTARGEELQLLKKFSSGIAFYGSGYVRTCDEKALSLRSEDYTVVIEKGCRDSEDCLGYSYTSLRLLKNSLDPNHVLCSGIAFDC